MTPSQTPEPDFGTYALPAPLARLRTLANRGGTGYLARRMASLVRKVLYLFTSAPYDVPVFASQHVRLYPKSNRCEKRAFVGLGSWDAEERALMAADIAAHDREKPFVFLDCGANIGLYSLFVRDQARAHGLDFRGLAIEPDPINQRRLGFNLQASGADDIAIAPFAVGRDTGFVQFVSAVENRGEARVVEDGTTGATIDVPMQRLGDIVQQQNLPHINILKIDIEGHELQALEPFFAEAPRVQWPEKILIEVGHGLTSDAMDLCLRYGYTVQQTTNINVYLKRGSA